MDVQHNEAQQRFESQLAEGLAILDYELRGDSIAFVHTGVPEEASGRGVGAQLVKAGLEYAHSKGLKVIPACPFVAAYLRRHPDA